MIGRLCTPNVCNPHPAGGCSAPQPRDAAKIIRDPSSLVAHDSGGGGDALDDALASHIANCTQMVVADGAGDGHIAFDNMKRSGVLPNIIVRHYDQAHGARRLTSRPWSADVFTQDVVDTIVFDRNSLTMILQNSPEFQKWLQSNLKHAESDVDAEALATGIRKHRWDSTQLPLARAVLRHHAMVMTALQMARARKREHQGQCAEYYILYVSGSEGARRLLLLAMLADAGDESAMVLRAQDKELSNPADTAFWIAAYVRRIQVLFLEGACVRTGFTAVMLQTLKKPIVYTVRGTPLQSGSHHGASPADVQFCLSKMQCWARMAIATARAEFPEFTVMHAMSIFNLSSSDLRGDRREEALGGCAPVPNDLGASAVEAGGRCCWETADAGNCLRAGRGRIVAAVL